MQRYALELAARGRPELAADPALEYGFLLHDVGKIGVPDQILLKPGALTEAERRVMKTHTLLGEQMLSGVAFLHEAGVEVVRSHHERWDGSGYPDGLAGEEIPLGARIFAVADALDAITSDRPVPAARSWRDCRREIVAQTGNAVRPAVVDAFCDREHVAARDPQGVPRRRAAWSSRAFCPPKSRDGRLCYRNTSLPSRRR